MQSASMLSTSDSFIRKSAIYQDAVARFVAKPQGFRQLLPEVVHNLKNYSEQ
jgi:hypothetical protein